MKAVIVFVIGLSVGWLARPRVPEPEPVPDLEIPYDRLARALAAYPVRPAPPVNWTVWPEPGKRAE